MPKPTKRTTQNMPGLGFGPGRNGGRKGKRLRAGPGGLRETKCARAAVHAEMLRQVIRRHIKRKRTPPAALLRHFANTVRRAGYHYQPNEATGL